MNYERFMSGSQVRATRYRVALTRLHDLLFRSVFCFFLVELGSRKIIHVGVTCHPTDQWVAQQLCDVTSFGTGPKYLIRDNDSKFGAIFVRATAGAGIEVLRTPYHAPRECHRRTLPEQCPPRVLDHLLLFGDRHLARVVKAYVRYFNEARPHQGIRQQVPATAMAPLPPPSPDGKVISIPVLGGLHHAYHWVA